MCFGPTHPFLSESYADQQRRDMMRAADADRLLREADIPTTFESIRLIVGRTIVKIGTLIAGRRAWSAAPAPTTVPATPTALNLAR